jgi:hypothetical protein
MRTDFNLFCTLQTLSHDEGCHGRDRKLVGFRITYAFSVYHYLKVGSSNPANDEVYSIQHYVIKFVSNLRQIGYFLWVLWFHQPIKLTATI